MPLVAFSIRLDRIDETLLYQDKGGGWWLSCVCTPSEDSKGRLVVAQSIPKERFAAGEKGPQIGYWREIGSGNHASSGKRFDLSKYKAAAAQSKPPVEAKYPAGQEGIFPSSTAAFNAAQDGSPTNEGEPQASKPPHGFDDLGF